MRRQDELIRQRTIELMRLTEELEDLVSSAKNNPNYNKDRDFYGQSLSELGNTWATLSKLQDQATAKIKHDNEEA